MRIPFAAQVSPHASPHSWIPFPIRPIPAERIHTAEPARSPRPHLSRVGGKNGSTLPRTWKILLFVSQAYDQDVNTVSPVVIPSCQRGSPQCHDGSHGEPGGKAQITVTFPACTPGHPPQHEPAGSPTARKAELITPPHSKLPAATLPHGHSPVSPSASRINHRAEIN